MIGNHVMIASKASIIADNHVYSNPDKLIIEQGFQGGDVVIEDDVWIGCNSVILPNVTIGKGAVVAAGSVVSSDIPPYAVVVGNPARMISSRKKSGEKIA
jgi:acetyltransferase-like isoleucine patch superfamily enzyme